MSDNYVKKVVLVGIENSGKTSIALCLKGVKNLGSFSVKPTKELKIDNFKTFDTEFSIWDFPGQELLRNEPIDNFDSRIKNADKIIYVIDIQDNERYEPSIEYLRKFVNLIIKKDLKTEFSIFLHKFDPDIAIDDSLPKTLIKGIHKVIPPNFKILIFKTSIFTTFQKSAI